MDEWRAERERESCVTFSPAGDNVIGVLVFHNDDSSRAHKQKQIARARLKYNRAETQAPHTHTDDDERENNTTANEKKNSKQLNEKHFFFARSIGIDVS